jgi:2-polyprenyl-6-methoxyphenol hydroxylase-like FAD-dependent oxidoreductase
MFWSRWLRKSESHDLLRRLILETKKPQRAALTIRPPLKRWSSGRIAIAGTAAHPSSPVSLSGGDECVLDASMLLASMQGLQIPDDIPIALERYSKSVPKHLVIRPLYITLPSLAPLHSFVKVKLPIYGREPSR